jgi:hypothetical protein
MKNELYTCRMCKSFDGADGICRFKPPVVI